jgi:hypothetical protein
MDDGLRPRGCDGRRRRFRWGLDGSDKAVAALGKGLDPTGAIRGIVESVSETIDGSVKPMLEIDKRI